MTKLHNAYDTAVDYLLGVAFEFWLWLGEKLGVEPEKVYYTSTVEVPDLAVIRERDELRLQVDALLRENAAYAPYVKQGADNRPKLTEREVEDIRHFKRAGWTNKALAETYDINPATVSRIVRGIYYKGAA